MGDRKVAFYFVMETTEQKLTNLRKKRDALMTSFFWVGLQIAVIFGVPAAIAAVLGTYLDKGEGNFFVTLFLILAFITSWIIVIFVYRKHSKKMAVIEDEIAEVKRGLDKKEDI